MQVVVNGEPRDVPAKTTVAELVQQLGFAGRRVAVEVNQDIVPRSEHALHRLADGDRIEVVAAIGGG
jgi:sulfur carrier protein